MTSSALTTSWAPGLISRFGGATDRLRDITGRAKNFAAKFHGQARGDQGTAELGAFDDDYTERHVRDNPIAKGEIFWCRVGAEGELTQSGALFQNSFVEFFVFLGVADVYAGAEPSDGAAVGRQGSVMADGINAASHTTDDDESTGRRDRDRGARPFASRTWLAAGAYDAEAGHIKDIGIAAQVKKYRRIVRSAGAFAVSRLGPVEEAAVGDVAGGSELSFGALEGVFTKDGSSHERGKAAGFKFGERSVEDPFGRAKFAQQARRQAARQAGGERQREPGEGYVQLHRGNSVRFITILSTYRIIMRRMIWARGVFGENLAQGVREYGGVSFTNDQGRPELDDIVIRPVGAGEDAALAESIDDVSGMRGGGGARVAIED
jgi:hypothetical protein